MEPLVECLRKNFSDSAMLKCLICISDLVHESGKGCISLWLLLLSIIYYRIYTIIEILYFEKTCLVVSYNCTCV